MTNAMKLYGFEDGEEAETLNYFESPVMTADIAREIGSDACDAWKGMMAMCGFFDSRILASYDFEARNSFAKWFGF